MVGGGGRWWEVVGGGERWWEVVGGGERLWEVVGHNIDMCVKQAMKN